MKVKYKGFEIEVTREPSLAGYSMLYYSIFRIKDGWEMVSGFEDSDEAVRDMIKYLKRDVDEYLKDPNQWEEEQSEYYELITNLKEG